MGGVLGGDPLIIKQHAIKACSVSGAGEWSSMEAHSWAWQGALPKPT